uniref:Uncharacterized protein n=1 Tax=Arundo donax TaxID=35708 RepID=A0A0A8Z3K5_ARUDO
MARCSILLVVDRESITVIGYLDVW